MVIKEIADDNYEFTCEDNNNDIFYGKLLDKKIKGKNCIESI